MLGQVPLGLGGGMTAAVKQGRPPLPDSERAKNRAIRLSDADYAELRRRGMQALREWLRR